jgi:hypothetical protein
MIKCNAVVQVRLNNIQTQTKARNRFKTVTGDPETGDTVPVTGCHGDGAGEEYIRHRTRAKWKDK